jgi:tetratricopeptide (TPR) repeat protein
LICRVLLIASLAAALAPWSTASARSHQTSPRQSFDQLLQAAGNARDENRDDEAIQLFRRALDQKPDSEEALWYLGSMLYEKNRFPEARDVLRSFLTLRSDAGPAWALLGMSEFQLREYPRALQHLQRAMTQGMGDRKELMESVFYHVAILLTRFERYDDSMDMLQKMLASGTPDPTLVEPAGLAGLRLPYLPAEIPPDQRDLITLAGKAIIALQMQRQEDASKEFDRLVAAYPNEPGVHFLRGAYLAELHPDDAMPEFERELAISPSHTLARIRLAQQLITAGKFDPALALAQQAIQLDPKRASAHMLAGEALIAKADVVGGIKELETARDDDPSIGRVHWDLLRAYTASGRKEDATREKNEIEKIYHGTSPNHSRSLGDSSHDSQMPQ